MCANGTHAVFVSSSLKTCLWTTHCQASFEPVSRIVQSRPSQDNATDELKIYHYHNNHLGTPQELTDENGEIVWANYEWAWGGRYTHHYTSQSLNDCAILETDLQPIRFQGQFYDVETGLHYNRFRYYDSDVGMFISRDPIGLLGGNNVFQYAPNPVGWVDPWGLARYGNTSGFPINRDNSKKLGENMALEGRPVLSGEAAGHIVASGGSKGHWAAAKESRDILAKYGIHINDAANGIPVGHPRPHNEMHNGDFHKNVRDRLKNIVTDMTQQGRGKKAIRTALRKELRKIGKECTR